MPAPNDLTPEEEAMFAQHGVASSGPGSEPVNDDPGQQGAASGEHGDRTGQEQVDHGDRSPPQRKRDEQGRFIKADGTLDENQQEEPNAQQQGQSPAPPPPPGFVPHAALHEARQREAAARQQLALLQARTNAILTSRQQQQPEALPDIEQDPRGYVEAIAERMENFQRLQAEQAHERTIDTGLEQDENLFSSYVLDYPQAAEFYVQSRARELMMFYPPDQVQDLLRKEARNVAQQAWQTGRPAAQVIYELAQARGYRTAPQQQQQQTQQGQSNGQQTQQGQSNGQQTPNAQIANIRSNQQQTRSLSSSAGSPNTQLNAEALLNMSDEEFEDYFKLGTKGADKRFASIG